MEECSKCGNKDPIYFFRSKDSRLYCRRCITFKDDESVKERLIEKRRVKPVLDYSLSKEQKEISTKIKEDFISKKNSIIYAVCGAGKTELVYEVISYCLSEGLQVGFTIPRKDVVIELYNRIRKAFPFHKVIALYSSHTKVKEGDIILLTTHQLYRYKNYFDLLIADEVDAFPFKDNKVLNRFFFESIKGNFIMMSATLNKEEISKLYTNDFSYYSLTKRYHNHPLIVPKVIVLPFLKKIVLLLLMMRFSKENKPLLVFLPTRDKCEELYSFVKLFIKKGNYVHSQKEDRDEVIDKFKKGQYAYLLTTSILERGITIKNLQVIVFSCEHRIFDSNTLIQISGRVGRKIDSWGGEVIYIASKTTLAMKTSIIKIKKDNDENFL